MEGIVFAALKGVVKVYKAYKTASRELGEYQGEVEELEVRVDAVIPIIEKVEPILHSDFVASLQLAKRYMTQINTVMEDTVTYVKRFSGKGGVLKLMAMKACSALPLESMGLEPNEKQAVSFAMEKFAGSTPEKLFDKYAERLQAAVGQLSLAITAQSLLERSEATAGGRNLPNTLSMNAKSPDTAALEDVQAMIGNAPISKKLQESAAKTTQVQMLKDFFAESTDKYTCFFLPTFKVGMTRYSLVLLRIDTSFYLIVRIRDGAWIRSVKDINEVYKGVGLLLDCKLGYFARGKALQGFIKGFINCCNSRVALSSMPACCPLKEAMLAVRQPDNHPCKYTDCEGNCERSCGSGQLLDIYINFATDEMAIDGVPINV